VLARYSPTIVLILWVLMLEAGISADVLRAPGLTALAISLAIMVRAETDCGRQERRRHHPDRRNR
jgi:hypothetical protein